jgi:hypothetical protein
MAFIFKISKSSDTESQEKDSFSKKRKKYHKKKKHHHKKSTHRSSDESNSDSDNFKKKVKSKRSSKSRSRSREKHSGYGLVKSSRHIKDNQKDQERAKSKAQIEIEEYKNKINQLKDIRGKGSGKFSTGNVTSRAISNQLSEEEKQKRLNEMQQNAQWRNEMRSKNVRKYNMDDRRDEEIDARNNSRENQHEASKLFKFVDYLFFIYYHGLLNLFNYTHGCKNVLLRIKIP